PLRHRTAAPRGLGVTETLQVLGPSFLVPGPSVVLRSWSVAGHQGRRTKDSRTDKEPKIMDKGPSSDYIEVGLYQHPTDALQSAPPRQPEPVMTLVVGSSSSSTSTRS